MSIKSNYLEIQKKINTAASKIGKDPNKIFIVAAGKNRTVRQLKSVVNLGIKTVGENTAQELQDKYFKIAKVKWHFIGHLQRNKIKKVIDKVEMIQSLDSLRLAQALNKELKKIGRKLPVLIQVNSTLEQTKYGIDPNRLVEFVSKIYSFTNLEIEGLMTIGKNCRDPNENSKYFHEVFELSKQIENQNFTGVKMKYLSMGMSNDFEKAIEFGANMIRLGRSLFDG